MTSLHFILPGPLHDLAGGRGEIRIEGDASSLSDALELLWSDSPAIRDRVLTERNEVRPHVNIFVDGEDTRHAAGLSTPITDGAEIIILPAVSGG